MMANRAAFFAGAAEHGNEFTSSKAQGQVGSTGHTALAGALQMAGIRRNN